MRIELTQNMVLRGLSIDQKPTTKAGAHAPNLNRTAYIVFDSHRDAPAGFGVKVSDAKMGTGVTWLPRCSTAMTFIEMTLAHE